MFILVFAFGLAIGSFLNVCIYRVPREGLSVSSPRRSRCPSCQTEIPLYDNIPMLSYLILRGRCRSCKVGISIIYPLVELMTGLLFVVVFLRVGLTVELLHGLLFVSLLLPIAWIDLEWFIIPNTIILFGLVTGLAAVALVSVVNQEPRYMIEHLIGIVAGGGGLALIAAAGTALFRKEAMGGGDVKLMALIGLFLGPWPSLLVVLVVSAIVGAIAGVVIIGFGPKGSKSYIPYGPFLAFGALLDLLWGGQIWEWYMKLTGWS